MSINPSDALPAVIEKYQSACQFFVKLDFGFLAAFTTAITIFGITTEYEIYGFVKDVSPAIYASLGLLVLGLVFDYWLLFSWAKVKLNPDKKTLVFQNVNILASLQLVLHVLFIFSVGTYIVNYSSSYATTYAEAQALMSIQDKIEQFNVSEGRFPADLNELVNKNPPTILDINILGIQNISYELDNQHGYILRYAWRDKQIGTSDDKIFDHFDYLNRPK
jgi:hypothetical protein